MSTMTPVGSPIMTPSQALTLVESLEHSYLEELWRPMELEAHNLLKNRTIALICAEKNTRAGDVGGITRVTESKLASRERLQLVVRSAYSCDEELVLEVQIISLLKSMGKGSDEEWGAQSGRLEPLLVDHNTTIINESVQPGPQYSGFIL